MSRGILNYSLISFCSASCTEQSKKLNVIQVGTLQQSGRLTRENLVTLSVNRKEFLFCFFQTRAMFPLWCTWSIGWRGDLKTCHLACSRSHFIYISPHYLFIYCFLQMMSSVRCRRKESQQWCSSFSPLGAASQKPLRRGTACVPVKTLPGVVSLHPAGLHVSLQLSNLERATEKFSSVSDWDIDMGWVTNGQMHRQQSRPSIKQFLVS